MAAGSESEHQDAGMGIAEAGDGLAPVFAVTVGAALLAGNLLAIRDQARTAHAGDDFRIQDFKPSWKGHFIYCSGGHSSNRKLAPLVSSYNLNSSEACTSFESSTIS